MLLSVNGEQDYVNADDIVTATINVLTDDGPFTVLEMRDGRDIRVRGDMTEELDRVSSPVVPAQPGFTVHYAYDAEDEVAFTERPVVAWRIDPLLGARPLMLGYEGRGARWSCVRDPAGRVFDDMDRSWATLSMWQEDVFLEATRERQQAKQEDE